MTSTTQIEAGWGAGPSERYEALIAPFRPIFARIRDGAVERERAHRLLFDELRWLREAGFPRLRLPVEAGGFGATLPELFAALIELGEADPSVVNALRSHLGFTEEVLASAPGAWRDGWLARFAAGETTGSGFSELGDGVLGSAATRLTHDDGQRLLNGEKYYTSGSLYADWIHLSATDEAGAPVGLLVPVRAPGVEIDDDWDGFGQQLSASGTARFADVAVDPLWLKPSASRFGFAPSFFQLVHLATLAGIARAATGDVARLVAERTRIYGGRTQARRVSEDPQVLEVVGKVRGAAYVAGATVLKAAEAVARAAAAVPPERGATDTPPRLDAHALADIEIGQSVMAVTNLVLGATTELFDALGSSAAKRSHGLDRHWRNARTIASHNPRIYHNRLVGDFAVNGRLPSAKGGIGTAPPEPQATPAVAPAVQPAVPSDSAAA